MKHVTVIMECKFPLANIQRKSEFKKSLVEIWQDNKRLSRLVETKSRSSCKTDNTLSRGEDGTVSMFFYFIIYLFFKLVYSK